MQFGLFLIHRRVISRSEFINALEVQVASRPQIGRLALEQEMLTVSQVFQVLQAQSDLPDEMFGDLAIECGMMNEAALNELLVMQSERTKPMSEILVELGYLTSEQCETEMVEYRRAMEVLGVGEPASAK